MTDEQNKPRFCALPLERRVGRIRENWKKAATEMMKYRSELKHDGEWNIWICTFIYAPILWGIAAALCVWYSTNYTAPNVELTRLAEGQSGGAAS